MRLLTNYKNYAVFGSIQVVLATLAGIALTSWVTITGRIVSFLLLLSNILFSIYLLKIFDTRPDIVEAREHLKKLKKEYEEQIRRMESLFDNLTHV